MYEVEKEKQLKSLCIFVGVGKCNASCDRCAGLPLRKFSPQADGEIDLISIKKVIQSCYKRGARKITISSSGEPTLSPISLTKFMNLVFELSKSGYNFRSINLYSNGIRIGEDIIFCKEKLTLWKSLGLTCVYITVHHTDEKQNARFFNVDSYPPVAEVFNRIHKVGLNSRANLILNKNNISTFIEFKKIVYDLFDLKIYTISAWPVRDINTDKVDSNLAPDSDELNKMREWTIEQNNSGKDVHVLLEDSKIVYEQKEKLTLFPNGVLSNIWCSKR